MDLKLTHQRVELFKRITKIWRGGLVGEGVSLGVVSEVSKANANPGSISAIGSGCAFQLLEHTAAVFSALIIMEEASETVKQAPS